VRRSHVLVVLTAAVDQWGFQFIGIVLSFRLASLRCTITWRNDKGLADHEWPIQAGGGIGEQGIQARSCRTVCPCVWSKEFRNRRVSSKLPAEQLGDQRWSGTTQQRTTPLSLAARNREPVQLAWLCLLAVYYYSALAIGSIGSIGSVGSIGYWVCWVYWLLGLMKPIAVHRSSPRVVVVIPEGMSVAIAEAVSHFPLPCRAFRPNQSTPLLFGVFSAARSLAAFSALEYSPVAHELAAKSADTTATRFHYPQFRPDFGFGVDPGRLHGYPLAHLAGTWW
jgi:hypothetical protein